MGELQKPRPADATGLLLKVRAIDQSSLSAAARALTEGTETLLEVGPEDGESGIAELGRARWVRAAAAENPWDHAHALMRMGFAAGSGELLAAEPEFEQQWVDGAPSDHCVAQPQTASGGRVVGAGPAWHLDSGHSELRAAREAVDAERQRQVLVAHLDTGYDPGHHFRPAYLESGERNFVKGEGDPHSARDVTPEGGFLRNYGHGTGTIGILAGPQIGGAPGARILPIRIADSVVRFKTGTMAQGFDYALRSGAHILSMSMGGLASGILADAVNKCYAGGVVMVAAAGNNFGGLPVGSIVYPARMRRVVAACGIMADHRPYSGLRLDTMEGCHGPPSKMATAVAGYTPNIPWPQIGCPSIVDADGQGTSAATPQVAAAAALWLASNWEALNRLEPWARGEAIRRALFRSASLARAGAPHAKLGWGGIRARAMLDLAPGALGELTPEKPAKAGWDWLKLLTGRGVGFASSGLAASDRMLGLELAQLAQRDVEVGRQISDPDVDQITPAARRRFLDAAEASDLSSTVLKRAIRDALSRRQGRPAAIAPPVQPPERSAAANPVKPPPRRRLRVFALDPSLGGSLNSYHDHIATVEVRNEPDLKPGPVGEYIEVVDVDPGSNRFYPPVDLNNPNLLLQDGLPPSEGDPAFHQQMVYAVAMRTIEHFELALGRKALWAYHWSGRSGDPNEFVQRLRIYPHALRQENAYYSPEKKALLFGYFPASSRVSDLTPPGTMVFSCLSADIIAHETTHALLDGQARSFREASNPDVRAFHEAFADLIALFQQFTYRELVRREIAGTRGRLSAANLVGGLARQFGEGTGKAGPLRNYAKPDASLAYDRTFSTHARGSILVGAVYQAFLAIVERRTADLVRLATGGSGVLPEGAIHPDLVERLTDETIRSARHVLGMCIRALDYCPPVDITFGEYLRAIITADLEQVPVDRFDYRIAFLEAFRRTQLLPRSLRTVSVETLRWRTWSDPRPDWLVPFVQSLEINLGANLSRAEIFAISDRRREKARQALLGHLSSQEICDVLGLKHRLNYFRTISSKGFPRGTTFLVDNVRVAKRIRDDGELAVEIVAVIRQRRPASLVEADPSSGLFWFMGGATVIIDLLGKGGPSLRYVIRKPIVSDSRLQRERGYRLADTDGSLRAMYFGGDQTDRGFADREPFAVMHASRGDYGDDR